MAQPVESIPYGDVITFTPVLDTNAYGDNDVLFVATEVPLFFPANGHATLMSVTLLDAADQGASVDIDLYFFNATVTLGTINSAVSISDADAAKCLGSVSLTYSEHGDDLVNSILYCKKGIGLQLKAAEQTRSLYVAGVVRAGTPTYAASSIQIKLGYA